MAKKEKREPTFDHYLPDLIEPGQYLWQCHSAKEGPSRYGQKAYLRGVIMPGSPHCGVELFMVINRREGRAGIKSKFLSSWMIANYGKRPQRKDRMSYKIFNGAIFLVDVRTTTPINEDTKKPMPEIAYSVIDHLIERQA